MKLKIDDIVEIKKSEHYVPFVRVKGQKFYQVLKEKIGGSFKNEI